MDTDRSVFTLSAQAVRFWKGGFSVVRRVGLTEYAAGFAAVGIARVVELVDTQVSEACA